MVISACFTGHRTIKTDIKMFSAYLSSVIEQLIMEKRITDFYSGGCYGFDALASLTVLSLKEKYPQIKLHLILPCFNAEQTNTWSAEHVSEFQQILSCADSVEYTSEKYYNGCMKVRNARLVECASDYCISYYNVNDYRSGTGQTVRMAQKKGIQIINLFV